MNSNTIILYYPYGYFKIINNLYKFESIPYNLQEVV